MCILEFWKYSPHGDLPGGSDHSPVASISLYTLLTVLPRVWETLSHARAVVFK